MKPYSLRKSKKILLTVYQLWRRKRKKLLSAQSKEIQQDLRSLEEEIQKKNREGANYLALKCSDYMEGVLKKGPFEKVRDFVIGIAYALFVVFVLIRPMWFELYEIPTGSMRPTFKEKDRLVVSKTDFGINVPFSTKHLYFDPNLVKRSSIAVFTVAGLGVHDPDMKYFWLFRGSKQYVKRLMGLPGDTVFFYGGRLYGIDKEGSDISHELQFPSLSKINYVPIIHFDGGVSVLEPFRTQGGMGYRTTIVHQMNEPVAQLTALGPNRFEGELLHVPKIHDSNFSIPENYWQLWGIGNYAKVMIKRKDEIRALATKLNTSLNEELYLEIFHHPNLKDIKLGKDQFDRVRPKFNLSRSIIPLDEAHLKTLFGSLYTARFVVKNGYATRWVSGGKYNLSGRHHFLTRFKNVPDGTYEYYNGQAYRVLLPGADLFSQIWGGTTIKLGDNHPLMRYSPDLVRKLFNYGIDFDKRFASDTYQGTGRFAYFFEGDLYIMGSPIFKKDESVLQNYIKIEQMQTDLANVQNPYIPFIDTGPPVDSQGRLNVEFIRKYGLRIPYGKYLALGDNFANSGDSREFGFVPQGNLRGGPSFIFWPFGSRFGPPNQPPYQWLTLPNLGVWIVALIFFAFWYRNYRRHHRLPLKDL